jgi:hypothetical protein
MSELKAAISISQMSRVKLGFAMPWREMVHDNEGSCHAEKHVRFALCA